MTKQDATRIRVELARGHWQLGERPEAVACLERAASQAPLHDGLLPLVETCLEDLEAGGTEELALRLAALRAQIMDAQDAHSAEAMPAPLATPTVARLLAEQGHPEKALAVADDVLRRHPGDERALAVRASLAPPTPPPTPPTPPTRPHLSSNARVIAELERWLGKLAQRKHGGAWA
jgi:tetratricopeptide (TPR) repeat protein